MKKIITLCLLGVSLLPATSRADIFGGDDVVLTAILAQCVTEVTELQQMVNQIEEWKSLTWGDYRGDLQKVLSTMQTAQGLSINTGNEIADFQKLFPGYNDSKAIDANKSFQTRNSALLDQMQTQVEFLDEIHKMNSNYSNASFNSSAEIAQQSLQNLRELNSLVESESRAQTIFRANEVQQKNEDTAAAKMFFAPHKMQDSYQTQIGDVPNAHGI